MSRTNKLSSYRTTVSARDGWQIVNYAGTEIVRWNAAETVLNTGGWKSVTTKRKMCQAARQFGLGYSVFQRKGSWFVDNGRTTALYAGDTFTIQRFNPLRHKRITVGYCPTCGHYGTDCIGEL